MGTDGSGMAALHTFSPGSTGTPSTNSDGGQPCGRLAFSAQSVFGLTAAGGSAGNGTLYTIGKNGTGFTVLHDFTATAGLPSTNADGAMNSLSEGLILAGNILFGVTPAGGRGGAGTIFIMNTDGTGYTALHHFSALASGTNEDGATPLALVLAGNTLYGTAKSGGAFGSGTIFKINSDGSGFANLYNFSGQVWAAGAGYFTNRDGSGPNCLLLANGVLYGTAEYLGPLNAGTVFSLNTDGTSFSNLHSFNSKDSLGEYPNSLIYYDGHLVGSTAGYFWGFNSYGHIYQLTTNGLGFGVLHQFSGPFDVNGAAPFPNSDGMTPKAGTITNGILYGTCHDGGTSGYGNVFSLTVPTNAVINYPDFSNTNALVFPGTEVLMGSITDSSDGQVMRLVKAAPWQSGCVVSTAPVSTSGFSSCFTFRFTDCGGLNGGADGIVFVISSNNLPVLGSAGGSMGYAGITNSVGVEFDIFNNGTLDNDANDSHVGINVNGNFNSLPGETNVAPVTPNMKNGDLWFAWVDYDGNKIEARVNNTGIRPDAPTVSRTLDLAVTIHSQQAYIGFTAATGQGWANHDIISWQTDYQMYNPITAISPKVSHQPSPQVTTLSGNATFTVVAVGSPPLVYQWLVNQTTIPGETNTTLNLTNVQIADVGKYQVMVANAFGSVTSSVAALTVGSTNLVANGGFETGDFTGWTIGGDFAAYGYNSVLPNAGNPDTNYIHSGNHGAAMATLDSNGTISQTIATIPGSSYFLSCWLQGDGFLPNYFEVDWNGTALASLSNFPAMTWSNFQFNVTATSASSTLQFVLRDDNTWLAFDDVSLSGMVAPTPSEQFTILPASGNLPLTVRFSAHAVDDNGNAIAIWNWNFGDGCAGTGQNRLHTYVATGTYYPSLTVTNSAGQEIVTYGPAITVVSSNLVVNGGFETGDFTGWTIGGDFAAYGYNSVLPNVGNPDTNYNHSGNHGAAMSTLYSNGTISQPITTAPGSTYLLSCWFSASDNEPTKYFEANWNGSKLISLTNFLSAIPWTNFQLTVAATSPSTPLQFVFRNDQTWFGFDDVSVQIASILPQLSVIPSGNNVVLSWPASFAGFSAQYTTNLNPPVIWMPLNDTPLIINGKFVLTNAPSAVQIFYRLAE